MDNNQTWHITLKAGRGNPYEDKGTKNWQKGQRPQLLPLSSLKLYEHFTFVSSVAQNKTER